MEISPEEIAHRLSQLVNTLFESRKVEQDKKVVKLYDLHIKETENLILSIRSNSDSGIHLKAFYEKESRNYGWSYLPNKNGEIAELEFWTLMKYLRLFKGEVS